ncbi:broad-specificity glycerol dehydrogenase, subunit SldA [Pelagibacterium halotolerans B2]|uniref:Broad-specificity glycerol dehydrogenase, subunit SldA n=1 Tax=Pelagibacterium halotolerans (strain DSM 22347 / JCM 15775 / CGMCC 1.7692 / B2) TaxID=1082931 RepID=G4RDB2_PELHB|nr:membrane-bound PQQ-dependent dehydrogenase, glucose/quinate/shikimate family [Pelagibacterium halotolerans]AEQ50738.1 broad-specificity glycerol dehydrogenase, subunit SldA [Pelagibacterium halotolerans B2]
MDDTHRARRGFGFWSAMVIGAIIAIFGVPIFAGGIWLAALGGSWYYVLAGLGLLVTAVFLFRRSMLAVWVYLATFAGTVAWALWEAGFDGWAQVPRLVAPTVVLVLVLATIPALRGRLARPVGAATAAIAGGLALAGSLTVLTLSQNDIAVAQDAPAPTGIEARSPLAMMEVGENWPAYGGTYYGTRYSPLDQITPDNVGELTRVWEYNSGDMPEGEGAEAASYSPENTPLKIGDDLYHCTPMGIMIAIDAATGLEEWRYDPDVSTDAIPYGATCRGGAYFEVPDAEPDTMCATRILWGTLDARLLAVDARTGQPCPDFGMAGEVYLEEGIGDTVPGWYSVTSPPTIVRGIAVMGAQVNDGQAEDAPSGVVRGYDAVTGELAWAWDLENPDSRTAPAEGETYSRGTPNMWTIAAADEELGLVYLPLGNSAVDYYGSNRSELENEYATSIVAVDVTTGDDVWHFQTVYNDVWDYDLGSQPALVDFPSGEDTVPAIIVSSKQGDIYILDRATGEPLFAPEEREVPQGGVEPDYLSPTQPFSTYHTLAFEPLEERDMWGMTPLDQLWCRIQFRQAHYEGMYTPPTSDQRWIQYPGYNGGQDWGSLAVDEERGIMIANYNNMPNHNRLIPREEADEMGARAIFEPEWERGAEGPGPQLGSPYAIAVNAGWRQWTGLLCSEPPYGGIRAIDLETGETLWDQPFGSARKNGPWGIPSMLPIDIGTPNNGGPVVTAGGLIFIAATTDDLIRAIDIETGETVWQDTLPGGGQTTPIVYDVAGRQFLVIAPGGHHFMETPVSDAVIAWALPETGEAVEGATGN